MKKRNHISTKNLHHLHLPPSNRDSKREKEKRDGGKEGKREQGAGERERAKRRERKKETVGKKEEKGWAGMGKEDWMWGMRNDLGA